MLRIYFLILTLFGTLHAKECYQHYSYDDRHKVQTRFQDKVIDENKTIQASLHIRNLENNGSHYTIVWFENGIVSKDKINIESIYAPFMVKHSPKGFVIEKLYSLSKDKKLRQRLLAIVDSMQFENIVGIHQFKNAEGIVEVNQSKTTNGYRITPLRQLNDSNVSYSDAKIDISLDLNCSIWQSVTVVQTSKMIGFIPSSYLIDKHLLKIVQSDTDLPKNHWFRQLDSNISSWDIGNMYNKISKKDALSEFGDKHKEMMALINNRQGFIKWMRKNMDFLDHLSEILESQKLDNEVSMNLFAKLGYLNSVESSKILAEVTLNENINETERFRALMGLKNTSAPLDDTLLNDLLDYGLNPDNDEDWLKNATGMLMGALANERVSRSPEQVERINDVLLDAVTTQDDKRVVMAAIGNMGKAADNEIIQAVDDVVTTSDEYKSRREAAQAIAKLNRTDLDSESFRELITKENNSDTKAQLIKASIASKDFNSNKKLKKELLDLADNVNVIQSNRIASLIALGRRGYGKSKKEKAIIRTMMMGEKDAHIMKILKKIYRK